MSRDLEPPPSRVQLVGLSQPDSIWKTWLNNLYEKVREIVAEEVQKTSSGAQVVANLTPLFESDFTYNVNPEIWDIHLNGSTASVDSGRLKLSTGASANSFGYLLSRTPIKHSPGLGNIIRFTNAFTAGVVGNSQQFGIGALADGFTFGFLGTQFGINYVAYGVAEARTLTIGTASTTTQSITITLDGDTASVPVTNSGDVTVTANEIAAFDYSTTGKGWTVHSMGDEVIFVSFRADPRSGTYSLSGATTAVGTFAQTIAGVVATKTFTAQTSWSENTFSLLDPTLLNEYQIQYNGHVVFSIKDPDSGDYVEVHRLKFTNNNALPPTNNPSLYVVAFVENVVNTSDISMYCTNVAVFREGEEGANGVRHGTSTAVSILANVEKPILTIHNPIFYQGKTNRAQNLLRFLSVSVDGNKPVTIKVYANATLVGASFNDVAAGRSTAKVDKVATTISGGDELFSFTLAKSGGATIDLTSDNFELRPEDFLTITAKSTQASDTVASINFEDRF